MFDLGASRPAFSRIAMNSISGVMIPWRVYQSCVTHLPGFARKGRNAAMFDAPFPFLAADCA